MGKRAPQRGRGRGALRDGGARGAVGRGALSGRRVAPAQRPLPAGPRAGASGSDRAPLFAAPANMAAAPGQAGQPARFVPEASAHSGRGARGGGGAAAGPGGGRGGVSVA